MKRTSKRNCRNKGQILTDKYYKLQLSYDSRYTFTENVKERYYVYGHDTTTILFKVNELSSSNSCIPGLFCERTKEKLLVLFVCLDPMYYNGYLARKSETLVFDTGRLRTWQVILSQSPSKVRKTIVSRGISTNYGKTKERVCSFGK